MRILVLCECFTCMGLHLSDETQFRFKPSPAWANFPFMLECMTESGHCHCVYSVDYTKEKKTIAMIAGSSIIFTGVYPYLISVRIMCSHYEFMPGPTYVQYIDVKQ
jgi:hypothetical protein